MPDQPDIPGIIRDRASAYGIDPDTLLQIGRVESGLNPNDAASSSSAKGLFQFIGPTWAQYGRGANVTDPVANADAGARFTRDNIAALNAAGIEPKPDAVYLAHFAGPGAAVKLMQADPSTPAAAIMGDAAVRANPFLANMTVGDMRAWSARKMSGAPGSAPMSAPLPTPGASPAGGVSSPVTPPAGMLPPEMLAAAGATGQQGQQQTNPALAQLAQRAQQMMAPAPEQQSAPMQPMNIPLPPGLARARMAAVARMRNFGRAG